MLFDSSKHSDTQENACRVVQDIRSQVPDAGIALDARRELDGYGHVDDVG